VETSDDPVALIRAEHAQLMPHLAHLDQAAAAMASLADDDVRRRLVELVGFLRQHLLDHAEAEERDLYPVVERLLRSLGGGTATMSRDHRAITAKVEALERLSSVLEQGSSVAPADRTEAARLLWGLAALLENHFAKEEEVYLPLLERGLLPEEAKALARRLGSHAAGHG
jgi:hemerythrin-like domain-containing protein